MDTTDLDTAPIRRLVVWLTIGSFSAAALMGVIALLGGGSFGESEGRVLLTTLIVGTASVAMLCYLATAGTRFQAFGAVGGLVVLLPTSVALLLTWGDPAWDDGIWQLFGVGVTLAATLAQMSLLLGLAGGRSRVRGILWTTVALAAVVAVIVCGMIVAEDATDGLVRFLGILAILDVLGTVITLALALFGNPTAADPGAPVRIPTHLEPQLAQAASASHVSREQVVADALERYFSGSLRS